MRSVRRQTISSAVLTQTRLLVEARRTAAGHRKHASYRPSAEQGSAALASARGLLFYLSTFALALPLFVSMLLLAPFVALIDRHRCMHAQARAR